MKTQMGVLFVVLSLSSLVGCAGEVSAPNQNDAPNAPAAIAPSFVDGSYQVTYTLDPNAWQTCQTGNSNGLADRWTVAGGSVTSTVAGTFSFAVDGDRIHGVSSHASEGENPDQRVEKDVFAAFDASGFSGVMVLSVVDGAQDADPQCSNTYVISGTRQ